MAVNKVTASSALRMELQYGVDGEGNPVLRDRSIGNVKSAASAQDVYDVAVALTGLQEHALNGVYQVDVGRLEEV
jgi:hypothetical protein